MIGNNTDIILLILPSLDEVIHDIANAPNNNTATHTHTIIPIKILQKNDPILTSLGALSNIATSGLFDSFVIFSGFSQI
ncbi:hypothetical protein J6T66_02050 [bacterium]|nr:hypothetical protein [bacterium]